jgi:hypothetical protein
VAGAADGVGVSVHLAARLHRTGLVEVLLALGHHAANGRAQTAAGGAGAPERGMVAIRSLNVH